MGCTLETLSTLNGTLWLLILGCLLILFVALLFRGTNKKDEPMDVDDMAVWPYVPRELMTPPERVLYVRLRQALPEYLIFSQVQLCRMIEVSPEADKQSWFNRINRMSVDFVICAPDGARILAAIELDDSSHQRADRVKADNKKDKALASAGIRIIRWPVKGMPNAQQIRADFLRR
ncbi:DUF2726 domain-containing protein [Agitococcus lubricus]|uniref:Uncharacterized protein DUF2726 n=1 Tax=Agitococcus lubricus TaxID=1077255 RepID=A0A2T5IVN9_9GAMM|nr:DUF2726 domain-containing protein [Agitococcus lubricus]PTQ87955.1 uncharacterized protein DUF2726 [Agitococcus lubricus]